MAARGPQTSFGRIFGGAGGGGEGGNDEDKPSVHELFSAAMRDEIRLRDFEELLCSIHGIRLTPAATRLLASTDATSGRLSFQQFQRALGESVAEDALGGAGRPNVFKDQAAAIITDNCGEPVPGPTFAAPKVATDITADEFAKQHRRVAAQQQARGAFASNPVIPSNKTSHGNPMAPVQAPRGAPAPGQEDREVGQTATRMYVSGELSRREYEAFLASSGVKLTHDCELQRLIVSHEKVGDGNFLKMFRALQAELSRDAQATAAAATVVAMAADRAVQAAGVPGYGS